ncbi:DNA-directed DNA polymerase eta rad30, partial [Cladochytrium tenue]
MKQKLGEANGAWVYNICRGICSEAVTQQEKTKSFGSNKNLQPPARTIDELERWLDLGISAAGSGHQSRSCPLPPPRRLKTSEQLRQLARDMLKGLLKSLPCSHISLGVSGLTTQETNFKFSLDEFVSRGGGG